MPFARQWPQHADAIIEELLEAVFSMQTMLTETVYNEDQLPLLESHEAVVRKVGV
jgi:hypothetical protein